jgi:cytosine/adenosine deaminase-related metal-dependent hydrolase
MILHNITAINSDKPVSIRVAPDKIARIDKFESDQLQLNFIDAIIFPGLVNSHDHIDFNLFPQLGSNIYNNYMEWGNYIHQNYKQEIAAVLRVPLNLRIQWGIFKNLLGGVTTVVNHGARASINNAPINVLQTQCLHSVGLEKLWKAKLNNPLKKAFPIVTHIGEGCDCTASREIDELIHWNLLRRKLIGVHAVAMTVTQAKHFEAIVWCPESNFFLLNKTARVNQLKSHTSILFGTDSTLTGNWNIWDHLRLARKTGMLTDDELYNTLNRDAAKVWQLKGTETDLVVARKKSGDNYLESFFSVDPKDILLVLYKGNINLFDAELLMQLKDITLKGFSKIYIDGIAKYVKGDLPALIKSIEKYYPDADIPVTID